MPLRPWEGQRTPVEFAAAGVAVSQPLKVHLRLSGGLLSLLSPSEGRPVTCNMGLWQRKPTRVTSVHELSQGGVRGNEDRAFRCCAGHKRSPTSKGSVYVAAAL